MGATVQSVSTLVLALGIVLCGVNPPYVFAGPYGEEMTKCLVRSVTASDRSHLAKWLFVTMARSPDLESMLSLSPEQRDRIDRNAAASLTRLLGDSCGSETQHAIRYELDAGLHAYQEFLQSIERDIASSPAATQGVKDFAQSLDQEKLEGALLSPRNPAPFTRHAASCPKRSSPAFPKEAVTANIRSGHVKAVLLIDEKGNIVDAGILASDPPGVFDRAVRAAVFG